MYKKKLIKTLLPLKETTTPLVLGMEDRVSDMLGKHYQGAILTPKKTHHCYLTITYP